MLLNDCANTEYIKGRSNRSPTKPQAQQPPEAYPTTPTRPKRAKTRSFPCGYVEDSRPLRTQWAACFSSLYSITVSRHSGIMALMPYRA